MRKRARWERLSLLVDYDPGPRPPPFEEELNAKIEKNKNNDVVSNNDSALGGAISTSTSKNNYAATDVTSVPRVFEKKKRKIRKQRAHRNGITMLHRRSTLPPLQEEKRRKRIKRNGRNHRRT